MFLLLFGSGDSSFTICTAPGSEPSNITGTALNSTHIYLTWDPPPPEDINGVIREYRIIVTEGETGLLLQYTTNPDTRELVVGPLHPYYTYHCTVGAYTVEVGPYTAIITVQTDEAGKDNIACWLCSICVCATLLMPMAHCSHIGENLSTSNFVNIFTFYVVRLVSCPLRSQCHHIHQRGWSYLICKIEINTRLHGTMKLFSTACTRYLET